MEIEQKYRVDDERVFEALRELRDLDGYTLHLHITPEQQHNIYFDTSGGRLRTAKHGLRVRELPDKRIATLKGPASGGEGRSARDEWEVEIGAVDTPAAWPPSQARDHTLALVGDEPLVRLLTIDTTRQHIIAIHNESEVAELSMDEGTILAGGHVEAFRELEIELKGEGTPADLDALSRALRARFHLVPDDRSKLARGLALLARDQNS